MSDSDTWLRATAGVDAGLPDALRSGQVVAAAGVNVETLRYYERRGLLAAPDRSLGGHRLWPKATVGRLRFIKSELDWLPPWERLTPLDAAERSDVADLARWLRERGARRGRAGGRMTRAAVSRSMAVRRGAGAGASSPEGAES